MIAALLGAVAMAGGLFDPMTGVERCEAPVEQAEPSQVVAIEIYLGHGNRRADLEALTRTAATVWEPAGVTLTLQGTHLGDGLVPQHVLAVGTTPEQMLTPVREWLTARARPVREGALLVVIVDELAEPGSTAATAFDSWNAVTFVSGADDELTRALGMAGPFTPTIFIDIDAARGRPSDVSATLAHEIGHVLGLSHAEAPSAQDLMGPGPWRCLPTAPTPPVR